MIRAGEFAEYAAFAAVAEARSFRRAAAKLSMKPSTLSHAVRALEERLGVRLLARTTRMVAPTEAGLALLLQITPALSQLNAAAEVVNPHRTRPHGLVRLTIPQGAVSRVLAPAIGAFAQAYPDVTLDIVVDDGFHDVVADGFDAGIRLGESVAPGMTAVRVSGDMAAAIVAAPSYWAAHAIPTTPRDLTHHRCIRRRFAVSRGIADWRFSRGGEWLDVSVNGPMIANSERLILCAAVEGIGVAMLSEHDAAADLAAGRLIRVLDDWCPPIFAFYLYHPSHRLASASLRAFIEAIARSQT